MEGKISILLSDNIYVEIKPQPSISMGESEIGSKLYCIKKLKGPFHVQPTILQHLFIVGEGFTLFNCCKHTPGLFLIHIERYFQKTVIFLSSCRLLTVLCIVQKAR